MKIKSIDHIVEALDKLVNLINEDNTIQLKKKILLLDGINYSSFFDHLFIKNIDGYDKKETDFIKTIEERQDKIYQIIEKYEQENGILHGSRNFFAPRYHYSDPELLLMLASKIIEMGDEYSFLLMPFNRVLKYLYREKDFTIIAKKVFDAILENYEHLDLNSDKINYWQSGIMIVNHPDFALTNKIATNFTTAYFFNLNNNKSLKEEFLIAKDFYIQYQEKIKELIITSRDTLLKGSDAEEYNWFSQYWIERILKNIRMKSSESFGFEKLEKKIVKNNLKCSVEDRDYVLTELYKLLDKKEKKVKEIVSYNIEEEPVKVKDEIIIISKIKISNKRGFQEIITNKNITYDEYDIALKKMNDSMVLIKINDKTKEKVILKNEYQITDVIKENVSQLFTNIKNERKKNIYDEELMSYAEMLVNNFFNNIDQLIRSKRLLEVTNTENVKSAKAKKKL